MTTREPATGGQIPLQAGIMDRLERLSALMGVPSLSLASHAIQSWVAEQERALAFVEGLGNAVGGDMGLRLKNMLRAGLFGRQQNMAGGPELTAFEIGVIAEQENLSTTAAAGLGGALLLSKEGLREIQRLIEETVEKAKAQGESEKAGDLERILARFKQVHPS